MIAFLVALVVAAFATPAMVWLAHRWELLDVPNHRSSHATPTPRGGGIAVAIATAIGVAVVADWSRGVVALLVVSCVLGAVGLADDRWNLPAVPRLAAQLLAPAIAVLVFARFHGVGVLLAAALAAFLVAGYVNAFNFMDGINGISGVQTAVVGVFLAVLAHGEGQDALTAAGLAIAGAALGFLPLNLIRPMIFLGDVGSYFIGAWLAGLALLVVDSGVTALVVLPPFLLYLLDTSTVIVRRARRGAPLMEAHREHAYQRLVGQGRSHASVALLCGAMTAACAVLALLVRDRALVAQVAALAASLVLVVVYLWLPARSSGQGGAP